MFQSLSSQFYAYMIVCDSSMTQTIYSYMHYRTFINPKQQNLKKSKSVNQILLMELTLGNSEISSCHATFISAIILMSLLQTKKESSLFYHTSKDQPLAGSNPVSTTQPIPHIGCGTIKHSSASWKMISVLTTLSELPKNLFPNSSWRKPWKSWSITWTSGN